MSGSGCRSVLVFDFDRGLQGHRLCSLFSASGKFLRFFLDLPGRQQDRLDGPVYAFELCERFVDCLGPIEIGPLDRSQIELAGGFSLATASEWSATRQPDNEATQKLTLRHQLGAASFDTRKLWLGLVSRPRPELAPDLPGSWFRPNVSFDSVRSLTHSRTNFSSLRVGSPPL